MINAYKNFFKNYAEFTGRSTRPDYWWVWLGNFVISIPLLIILYLSAVLYSASHSASEATFMFTIPLGLYLPSLRSYGKDCPFDFTCYADKRN